MNNLLQFSTEISPIISDVLLETIEEVVAFSVDPTRLIFSALFGIVLLLLLITKFKIHPVLALLATSLSIGLGAGMSVEMIAKTVEEGAGKTLQSIVLLIALGSMFGGMLEISGGAKAVAQALIDKYGEEKAGITLGLTGLIFGTIVFFEVGVMILIPLAFTLAKKTNKSSLYYVIPLLAGLASGFAFIPPSAGSVLVSNMLGVDLGVMILVGIPTGIVSLILAGVVFSKFISDNILAPVPNNIIYITDVKDSYKDEDLPSVKIVIMIILIPLFLILLSTLTGYTTIFDPIKQLLLLLGTPFVSLMVAIVFAMYILGKKRGYSNEELKTVFDNSLRPTAGILLVITGGSVVSEILQVCGMGEIVTFTLESSGLPLVLLAFLIASSIRICVGAAVVSMTMTAGIISTIPAVADLSQVHLACIVLAINGGATAFSHFNDSGFWLASSLLKIDEKDTLKSWTVMESIVGITGLCCALVIWVIF